MAEATAQETGDKAVLKAEEKAEKARLKVVRSAAFRLESARNTIASVVDMLERGHEFGDLYESVRDAHCAVVNALVDVEAELRSQQEGDKCRAS